MTRAIGHIRVTKRVMGRQRQEAYGENRWSGWWARQGSNLRPLGCKPSALPLSYAPGNAGDPASMADGRQTAARAFFHASWFRGSPGPLTSAKRTVPVLSTRNVPRSAKPAFALNTP
jgi:hypothetical protein